MAVLAVLSRLLSCHACGHVFGGRLKHFSRHPIRYWLWTRLSALNARHMQFAWLSLVLVMVTDPAHHERVRGLDP